MSILKLEIQKQSHYKRKQRPDILRFTMPSQIPDDLLKALHETEVANFEEFCEDAAKHQIGILLEGTAISYSNWKRLKHVVVIDLEGRLVDINDMTHCIKANWCDENVITLGYDGLLYVNFMEEIVNYSTRVIEIDDIRNIAYSNEANCTWYVDGIKTDLTETIELTSYVKFGIPWKKLASKTPEMIKRIIESKPEAIFFEDDDVLEYEDMAALISRGINLVWPSSTAPSRAKKLYINSRAFKHPYASAPVGRDDDFDDITDEARRRDDLRMERESLNDRRRLSRDKERRIDRNRDDRRRSRRTRR